MPTEREREYYRMGITDGYKSAEGQTTIGPLYSNIERGERKLKIKPTYKASLIPSKSFKLSALQKYIKNKRNHIKYRNGKLNLKAMGVQYRKKRRR